MRLKFMDQRDKWDDYICTGYHRVYPSHDPELQDKYEKMIASSNMMYKDFSMGRPKEEKPKDKKEPSKTQPISKAKATNL
jgi:hypothetical protein